MTATNFGNSVLGSHDDKTYEVLHGRFGNFQVRAWKEEETHAVFFCSLNNNDWTMLATHPNGHSCKALAERILQVWKQACPPKHALDQFHYILACGGTGQAEKYVVRIINGGADL
jgi:hypothetical protein